MQRLILLPAGALALIILTLASVAAPQVSIEADPNKEYPINPLVGKWVICVASYTGPECAGIGSPVGVSAAIPRSPASVCVQSCG